MKPSADPSHHRVAIPESDLNMADIVDDFLARLEKHVPDLPIESRAQLEKDVRTEWGGRKPYVAKQVNRLTRTTVIAHGLRQQLPLREVFSRAGVSTRTGFRLLRAK